MAQVSGQIYIFSNNFPFATVIASSWEFFFCPEGCFSVEFFDRVTSKKNIYLLPLKGVLLFENK